MTVRVVALGNESAGDDAAAVYAARLLDGEFDIVIAGRPGVRLLDLLEGRCPTVLVDVTHSGQSAGQIIRMPLSFLPDAALSEPQFSSHGFGPAEALRLGSALGRSLPPGTFIGIEGDTFDIGCPLSTPVAAMQDQLVAAIRLAADELVGDARS